VACVGFFSFIMPPSMVQTVVVRLFVAVVDEPDWTIHRTSCLCLLLLLVTTRPRSYSDFSSRSKKKTSRHAKNHHGRPHAQNIIPIPEGEDLSRMDRRLYRHHHHHHRRRRTFSLIYIIAQHRGSFAFLNSNHPPCSMFGCHHASLPYYPYFINNDEESS
jgi:hypothetical protein